MDLLKTKEILEVLDGVDIAECAIYAEDGKNKIRAVNTDQTTIVFTEVDQFIDDNIGLLSVKGLLSRLNLFDLEKAGVTFKTNEKNGSSFIEQMTIKEGRRRSSVRATSPKSIDAPTQYPQTEKVFNAYLSKSYVNFINKMKSSIAFMPSNSSDDIKLTMTVEKGSETANLKIVGGTSDDFSDEIECDGNENMQSDTFVATWTIDSLMRVLKRAAMGLDDEDTISVEVNDVGVLEVVANGIVVSVMAMDKKEY